MEGGGRALGVPSQSPVGGARQGLRVVSESSGRKLQRAQRRAERKKVPRAGSGEGRAERCGCMGRWMDSVGGACAGDASGIWRAGMTGWAGRLAGGKDTRALQKTHARGPRACY